MVSLIDTCVSTIPKFYREVLWSMLLGELLSALRSSEGSSTLYEYAEQHLQLEPPYVRSYMRLSRRFAERADEVKSIPIAGLRALAGEQLTDEEAERLLADVLDGKIERRSLSITEVAFRLSPTAMPESEAALVELAVAVEATSVEVETTPEGVREVDLTGIDVDTTLWGESERGLEYVEPPVDEEIPLLPSMKELSYRVVTSRESVEQEMEIALQTVAGRLRRWSELLAKEASYVERVLKRVH